MKSPAPFPLRGFHDLKGAYFKDECGARRVARFRMESGDLLAHRATLARLSLHLENYRSAQRKEKFANEEAGQ